MAEGSDNVDIFKKIIFKIPSVKITAALIILVGFLGASLNYLFLDLFTRFTFSISIIPLMALLAYILPALISAEVLHRSIPEYPRKWGLFLGLSTEIILVVYASILTGSNTGLMAWKVFWIAILTVYVTNMAVLLITVGDEFVRRVAVLSSVQPVLILAGFHFFLGRQLSISPSQYAFNFVALIIAGIVLGLIFLIADFLLSSNVPQVSAIGLTSSLLQKKQEALDLGYICRPTVQTVEIENETGSFSVSVPWIHPGPLEGFGGGNVTSTIIDRLNREGRGFFWHVPSTHSLDPADPGDTEKLLDAMESPDKCSEASKMVQRDYELASFRGRNIDGKKIVFMDVEEYDDYDSSIFQDVIDPNEVIVVDTHSHEMDSVEGELFYGTVKAEKLRSELQDFLEFLDRQETHPYSAGISVDTEDTSLMALVEEVDGQRTVIQGIEGNEVSKDLLDYHEVVSEEFDQAVLFSTDTHRSIHQMASNRQVEISRLNENLSKAEKELSPAKIGFTGSRADEMKLLKQDYLSLIFSINIIVRLLPLMLILFYLSLTLWIFL